MLKIYFGNMEESIYNTAVYFDNIYEEEWITTPLAKEIIKDIDDSLVIGGEYIQSPILGPITPSSLSGGTKTLLLMLNEPETIFNASTCGDNCAKWILKLAQENDFIINLRHIMDFGDDEFEIEVWNNHQIVHNMKELLPFASKYLRQEL